MLKFEFKTLVLFQEKSNQGVELIFFILFFFCDHKVVSIKLSVLTEHHVLHEPNNNAVVAKSTLIFKLKLQSDISI